MTDEATIALCRDLGWHIEETYRSPRDGSCYDIGWPAGGPDYDYQDCVCTGDYVSLADCMKHCASAYIAEDAGFQAGRQFFYADDNELLKRGRLRVVMELTLRAIADRERKERKEGEAIQAMLKTAGQERQDGSRGVVTEADVGKVVRLVKDKILDGQTVFLEAVEGSMATVADIKWRDVPFVSHPQMFFFAEDLEVVDEEAPDGHETD